mgnify:CR=1 FL=1
MKKIEDFDICNVYDFKALGYNNVHVIGYVNFIWGPINIDKDDPSKGFRPIIPRSIRLPLGKTLIDFIEENLQYNIVIPRWQPKVDDEDINGIIIRLWVDKWSESLEYEIKSHIPNPTLKSIN